MRWTRMLFIPRGGRVRTGTRPIDPHLSGYGRLHDRRHERARRDPRYRGADVICGRGGADELHGAGGNDVLRGGRGDDSLLGNDGNDLLVGGPVVTSCPTVEATTS